MFLIAGELGIFGTVLDEKENFPFLPRRASLTTPTRDLFGVAGVEILLGLAQDGRTSARQGINNTTIILVLILIFID